METNGKQMNCLFDVPECSWSTNPAQPLFTGQTQSEQSVLFSGNFKPGLLMDAQGVSFVYSEF